MMSMLCHSRVPRSKIQLPQERIDAAIAFMKLTAKLVIEDQYDRKFLSLKAEESKLEQYLWGAQVREANNLEGSTPVLNKIAAAKGRKFAEVAKGVLAGHDKFNQKVVALYEEMLKLKQKFKDCCYNQRTQCSVGNLHGYSCTSQQSAERDMLKMTNTHHSCETWITILINDYKMIDADQVRSWVEGSYGIWNDR